MTYDRIIIRGEVTAPYFHLYIYKNGERADSVGVLFEDLADTVVASLKKYELDTIELSGPRAYTEGIQKNIQEAIATEYNFPDITFRYV